MKRSEAEKEVVRAIIDNPSDYKDLTEVIVADAISSWDDDQLADFLWGDDDSQKIQPD